ncbi:uncharacterized protein LOC120914847 [Rana temporaria]|uniref:uncharacterized protein LOC120914847 n=1 Tax=Rana temporaria TaxID=8407 RepID=UPI001AAD50A3|nr:uncharacterized protein LOC120914847 [Rana temporaria]
MRVKLWKKEELSKKEKLLKLLVKEIEALERQHKVGLQTLTFQALTQKREELKELFHLEQKQWFRMVAQSWHEWGNKPGWLLARSLQQKKSATFIAKIKSPSDSLVYETSAIASEFRTFYQAFYHVQHTVEDKDARAQLIQIYLQQARLPSLPADTLAALEGEFTTSELCVALKAMANGKAPVTKNLFPSTNSKLSISCRVYQREYRQLLAFIFAIDEINRSPDILPNITLGYHVYDSCGHVNKAIKDVLQVLSGHTKEAPNYSCMERGALAGFIGDLNSDTTLQMAQLLSLYGYTQVRKAEFSILCNVRTASRLMVRWVKRVQITLVVKYKVVLKKEGSAVISYGARDTLLSDRKMYPNFFRTVPDDEMQYVAIAKLLERLKWNWVGILTSDDEYGEREIRQLSKHLSNHGICIEFKILVSLSRYVKEVQYKDPNGEVMIFNDKGELARPLEIVNWITRIKDRNITDWMHVGHFDGSLSEGQQLTLDPERISWKGDKTFLRRSIDNASASRKSVGAYGFTKFAMPLCCWRRSSSLFRGTRDSYCMVGSTRPYLSCEHFEDFYPFHLPPMCREAAYEARLPYTIISVLLLLNRSYSSILSQVPRGQCSEECLPGFRKSVREGYHPCCYNCAPCSEGEISNQSDSELCKKCPENEWPNKAKTICSDKVIEYLSYEEDILVLFFSITSVIFATTSLLILGLFVWFRSTPIVRANNRNLSFILLLSLILSFLSVFLFLGRPVDITCMLQQVTFGVPFTISASSILAKTIMVFIAFKATRPGSSCRKWVGVKLPNTVMLFCSSIQVMNCILWLSISPPFQEYDMDSYPGKIIIRCNEGSVIGFYSMLGYMGFLAAVSFLLAFIVRTLPDSFNEAKYITFSMLVFCSVWIAMIPAYLSTKGKYMVAVEIFAILTSSAGILLCMFSPKLYILLFKPELNTRGTMLGKRMMQM